MERLSIDTIIGFVDGELTMSEARRVEESLAHDEHGRAAVRRLQETRQRLAAAVETEPDSAFRARVMAKIDAPQKSRHALYALAPVGAIAAIFAVVATTGVEHNAGNQELVARGAAVAWADAVGVESFVHRSSAPGERELLRASTTFSPGDGLSFVTYNRTGEPVWLLLFARDSADTNHWFYPATVDGTSVALAAAPQVSTLPDGVTPQAAAGVMQVVAIFSKDALRADHVDSYVQQHGLDALSELGSVVVQQTAVHRVPQ